MPHVNQHARRIIRVTPTITGVTYANFTTATLALSEVVNDTLDGYKYRVKINTSKGAAEVISDGAAALTFGS